MTVDEHLHLAAVPAVPAADQLLTIWLSCKLLK